MMLKVTPFETYQHYLSLKNHFTNPKYDFFKYGAKTRASMASFNKRKDKYWFEKTSRKYSNKEIVNFLVSNFVSTDNPQNLWIGEIINSGERKYADWMKRQQSLTYLFKEQSNELLSENDLESLFDCSKGHLTIYEIIVHFSKNFDKKLNDPVWESVNLKIKKYTPFLNINVFNHKIIIKEILGNGS